MSWHDFLTYSIYRLLSASVRAVRRALAPKPCCHGVVGPCQRCQAEAAQRLEEEFAKSPIGVDLARQERLREIYDEYWAIEDETRERLRFQVEDRIRRYHLMKQTWRSRSRCC